jgi:hypothetical protein
VRPEFDDWLRRSDFSEDQISTRTNTFPSPQALWYLFFHISSAISSADPAGAVIFPKTVWERKLRDAQMSRTK